MRAISLFACAAALAAQTVDDGLAAFHNGDYVRAEKILSGSADPRAQLFTELSRAATGRCHDSVPRLEALLAAQQGELRRLTGLGLVQCHVALSQLDRASALADRLKAEFPSDADVLYQAARVHMRAWNDVIYQLFQKAPASYRVNHLSAEVFETQANYGAAVAEYRKAIAKNPAAINLHFRLGRALLLESHEPAALAAALAEFQAELKINPFDAVAEYQVAQVLTALQRPAEAEPRLRRALELNPALTEAQLALGKLRLDARDFPAAISLLEEAVRKMPASENARYSLMIAYRNAGRMADAVKQKEELDRLQKPPEGEFTEFLKKLGERKPQP
ncbi:MAG: tetratricopeptide repeat protein [Acidobacteria bacterium]|nr:tetratricopeptide repeat protein [Acidobacteriota bacterium]